MEPYIEFRGALQNGGFWLAKVTKPQKAVSVNWGSFESDWGSFKGGLGVEDGCCHKLAGRAFLWVSL